MRLICYKAMCGDAFHLQFEGESGKNRNLFLDMGHPMTYSQILKDVISKRNYSVIITASVIICWNESHCR